MGEQRRGSLGKDEAKDTWLVSKEEAAFILGKGGRTKAKLTAVSGAHLELTENRGGKGSGLNAVALNSADVLEVGAHRLDIIGTLRQREHACKYVRFVTAQRLGPVCIGDPTEHDDLTLMDVPADAVSFITGKRGSFLRIVEEEWSTLLFFLQVDPKKPPEHVDPSKTETLAIFGSERARKGAELKVRAAIAMKQSGYYPGYTDVGNTECVDDGFATDTKVIKEEDYSYALGKNGSTRRKLAQASACIVEYIGRVAYFCGVKEERRRAREYFCWLLQQRCGFQSTVEHQGRDDVTLIMVPRNLLGYITGARGSSLRDIEANTSTFCFIQSGVDTDDQRPLLIFGRPEDRDNAEMQVWDRISQRYEQQHDTPSDPQQAAQGLAHGAHGAAIVADSLQPGMPSPQATRHTSRTGIATSEQANKNGKTDLLEFTHQDWQSVERQLAKAAKISGATFHSWPGTCQVTCVGEDDERRLAQVVIHLLLASSKGLLTREMVWSFRPVLHVSQVPGNILNHLRTAQGQHLTHHLEDAFEVIVFIFPFAMPNAARTPNAGDELIIIGKPREQRAAELRALHYVEQSCPGLVVGNIRAPVCCDTPGFATDIWQVAKDDQSYSLGHGGHGLRRVSRASNCIIEYVGQYAFFSGTLMERRRGYEYLSWLLQQRVGAVSPLYEGRDDCTVVLVPKDCIGFIAGHKGHSLHGVEEASSTFCLIEGDRDDTARDSKPLLIFGDVRGRNQAREAFIQLIHKKVEEMPEVESSSRAPKM